MTTPPPPKFKAYLGRLKETILDSDTKNVNRSFSALLAAELVQRGVLVDLNDDTDDKLLDAVISTAGRPLLDTSSSLPKPLLAATAAMAGMVAESCASLVSDKGQSPSNVFSLSAIQTALTRCNDVNDVRLSGLLQLFTTQESLETVLLDVAEGCFLRAASIQPDSPLMWKRSLDVMERRLHNESDSEPFEANLPLSHLIKIASNKGNEKRVSELSLRLAESWLSPQQQQQQVSASSLEKDLVNAFVTPYRPATKFSESECIQQASQALDKVNIASLVQNDNDQDNDVLLWQTLLQFRIEWATEQTSIDEMAQKKAAAAKNRGTSLSLDTCKESARSEVWVESLQDDDTFDSCAKQLLNLVLQSSDLQNVSPRLSSAMDLLGQQSERLVDRARVIALDSLSTKKKCTQQDASRAWNDVVDFTKPIVERIGELAEWNGDMELDKRQTSLNSFFSPLPLKSRLFMQSALLATSSWMWMTTSNDDNASHGVDLPLLELLLDSLSVCLLLEEEKERSAQDDNVLKSSGSEEGGSQAELQCAHATVLSLVGLACTAGAECKERSTLLTHEATRKAIGMMEKSDKYQALQGKYGSAYLLLLISWSGFHRSPWPFCNVTQARAIIRGARAAMKSASSSWGRRQTSFESFLLDLCEADAEGGSLIGGFENKAEGLYTNCLQQTEDGLDGVTICVLSLLKAHCLNGLARLSLHGKHSEGTTGPSAAQHQAEQALSAATDVRNHESTPFYLWKSNEASASAALFHINVSRQLVADALVRASRPGDAQTFLEDAVRDSPSDFDAAFALGAFRLRMALYESANASSEERKAAQTQLLKSAKINSTKPDPFALLGIWYEVQNDLKRALGCYSKALLLDPSNPVAGRGVLRLKSRAEAQKLCVAATNTNSPVNGWAWHAIGQEKAMMENDDELATICFVQALRCRDIECPQNEPLSIFFAPPSSSDLTRELSKVWADLAGCYRRVGRYAAAERAFQSAWQVDGDKINSQVFCSWAQVELELGLFEEAIEKFELVLEREKDSSHTIAAYGQGSALLALAHRDAVDGKAGAAFQHATRGIACIENTFLAKDDASIQQVACALKLLGDLYSFGALLPPDVFVDQADNEVSFHERSKRLLEAQASFVAKGEKAYREAAEAQMVFDENDENPLRAAILCDLGGNILLQGHIHSSAFGEGQGGTPELSLKDVIESDPKVRAIYDRSVGVFKDLIATSPLHGPAWCGLGCSLSATDPLLSQHALCTALTLDKTMPDSWSNLAFLFAGQGASTRSAEMLDGLTQVADSPLMWICRALLLENEVQSGSGPSEAQFSQAADAYRAALQVVKHPAALLGLSLTCRATRATPDDDNKGTPYDLISYDLSRRDSYGYMGEYLGLSSSCNIGTYVLGGAMTLEDSAVNLTRGTSDEAWRYEVADQARGRMRDGVEGLAQVSSRASSGEAETQGIRTEKMKDLIPPGVGSTITEKQSSPSFEQDLTPSRRVIHDPESGKAWLDLSKSLAKELLSISDKKKKVVKEMVDSATRASDRAAQILSDQLSTPLTAREPPHIAASESEDEGVVSTGVVPVPVKAREVSEALTLPYWLETVEVEALQEEEDVRLPKRAIDLQRAMFMDPGNTLARQAIQRMIPST